MQFEKRKVALVGTGMVGMSYAYALLGQGLANELVLIDLDKKRAEGEAMDLNHGLAFAPASMRIYAGDYKDCTDADIVVICAGVAQRPGESRTDLLNRNAAVFRSIVGPVVRSGFDGIFLVATNPVDIMTRIVRHLSGFPSGRVIGSGTTLDSARLRYLVGEYFRVDPRNVHGYVIGEHGDSEFVPWSQLLIATKPITSVCRDHSRDVNMEELKNIELQVRNSAQTIIEAKKATYYGIGMALVRITKAIFGDENSVLTVSTRQDGTYGISDVYAGIPAVVGRTGVKEILSLDLTDEELKQFIDSCTKLDDLYKELTI